MAGDLLVSSWNQTVTTPPSKFHEYLIRYGVEGIEVKGRKFIFRCPICGDSSTNKSRKRGYLISNSDGNGAMGCHNCGTKTSFRNFLKKYAKELHSAWIRDIYVGISLNDNASKEANSYVDVDPEEEVVDYSLFLPLTKVSDHPLYKTAMEFICKRKIPRKFARDFLYCVEGRYSNRIIIPHYNKDRSFKHFEARDLRKSPLVKYLYPENWKPSNYNLPNLNLGSDYFVFEGVIDSLFLDNSGACGGAQKYKFFFESIHKSSHRNAVIFADGDEDGIRVGFDYLKKGYRVFKWTRELLNWKKGVHDLNGLIESGFFKPEEMTADGTVKPEVIMKYVIKPSLPEILCYQFDALGVGVNVNERKKRVEFVNTKSQINWLAW